MGEKVQRLWATRRLEEAKRLERISQDVWKLALARTSEKKRPEVMSLEYVVRETAVMHALKNKPMSERTLRCRTTRRDIVGMKSAVTQAPCLVAQSRE